jgi:hypothetical protein
MTPWLRGIRFKRCDDRCCQASEKVRKKKPNSCDVPLVLAGAATCGDRQFGKCRRRFKSRRGGFAFDVVFRDGPVAPRSFRLIEAAIAAFDHRLGGFGQPELRNPD